MIFLKKGKRWMIFLKEEFEKKIAVKKAISEEKKAAINKEINIIKKLNENNLDFVPVLKNFWDWRFEYEFIQWDSFKDYLKNCLNKPPLYIVFQFLEKVYCLDKLGIEHWELWRPFTNIIIWLDEKINIIDFERGKIEWRKGKNMRQLAQWLANINYLNITLLKELWKIQDIDNIYFFIKKNVAKIW